MDDDASLSATFSRLRWWYPL